MKNLAQNKLVLSITFGFISVFGFSQNQGVNSLKPGMRINHNQTGIVRGNLKSTISTQQQTNLSLFQIEETYEKDAVYANRIPEDELVEKRDRTSKHFQNPDGSIEAILSTGSLNYFENGKWHTIKREFKTNNTIKFHEFEYANLENSFKTYLSNDANKGIKTLIEGFEISEWQNKQILFLDDNYEVISKENATSGNINIDGAKAVYSNLFSYTDAHITQLHDGRKIDYEITSEDFLNQIPANAKYIAVSENIELPTGWKAEYFIDKMLENPQTNRQQISIFNEKGEEILRYMPPAYFEKTNQYDIENPVGEYEISQNGQTLTIKTITEADWFRNPNRTFPVVIDPTVSVYPNNTANWSRTAGEYGWNLSDLYFGMVNFEWLRGSVKFNLTSIPASSIVNSVDGYINFISGTGTNPTTRPWQFANSADPTTTNGTALYNSMTLGYSQIVNVVGLGWRSSTFFNPAGNNYIQNALSSGSVSIGIVPAGTYVNGTYFQLDNHTSSNRPYLSITYTLPSTPPTCTTPISPADGFGSHTPGDPLTWNAASGATSYDVYFGTSSNPPYVTNVATTSYSPSLADNTTYYWKIVPRNSSGTPTGCAVWEFTTTTGPANGDYRTRYLTGPYAWNNADNWEVYNGSSWVVASSLPSSTNNVLIRENSHYIVLNNPNNSSGAPAACNNIRIEGTLQFWNGLAALTDAWGTLNVYGDLDIMSTGVFETFVNVTGIEAVSEINMMNGGDINNFGTLSLYDEVDNRSFTSALICFYGNSTSNFTLASGSSTRLFYLSIAKDNPGDVVNFIVNEDFLAVNNDYGGNNGFLKSYNMNSWDETPSGHFIIKGSFAKNNPVWFMGLTTFSFLFNTSNGISSGLTVEIDNPNFGVMAQDVTFNLAGKLIVNQGQCDIGATSGNVGGVDQSQYFLNILDGGHLEINGGELNTRAGIAGNGTHYFTMTNGTVNVGRNANASSRGLFDLQGNPQINISGGKITLSDNRYVTNNLGYRVDDGNINITGGTLQIGTANSPVGSNTFSIQGSTPSIELYGNGTTIASNAIMWNDVNCFGYLDIPAFCGLSIYDQDNGDVPHTFSITGNINHEGNLYAEVENSKILFNGSANQIFHTTGAYNDVLGEAGISIIEVDNPAGVQLTGSSTAVTKNFIKTNGTFHIGDCSLGLSGIVTRSNGYFGGNSNSELYISGNGTLGNLFFDPTANNLKILEIDRQNTGIVNLATDLNVHQSINFVNGTLYTYLDNNIVNGSNTIFLQSYAVLFNENTNSYIYGKVSLTEDLMSAREPGNIGAYFSDLSENLGSTTIVRMTGDEAEQSIADATSIDCYWDINVSSQPSSAVSMSFEWFGNFDNALSTTNMSVFSKDGVDPWEEIGSPVSVSGNPRTITADADHFTRWTVAVKDTPLPVSLLYFDVQCNGHSKEFSWATASEINSDYFLIMESQDNENFKPIVKIEAAGNSNQTMEYRYAADGLLEDAYYCLKQIDYDGRHEEFPIIYSSCKNDFNLEISIYPNPFNGKELFINSSKIIENAVVEIYDPAGRIVYKTRLEQIGNDTPIKIHKKLEPGAYILTLNAKNNLNKQFVLIAK